MGKYHLYSNDLFEQYGSYEEMEEAYKDFCNDFEHEFSEDDMYEYYYDLNEEDYAIFFDEVPEDRDTYYIIDATWGRWNGTSHDIWRFHNLRYILKEILKDDTVTYYFDESGTLCVDMANHDACSYAKVYRITDRGNAYYDRHVGDDFEDGWERELLTKTLLSVAAYHENVPNWLLEEK